MKYFLYIVKCVDESLYTGVTKNLKRRTWEHNNSKLGAKALKGKRPVKLVYTEKYNTISEALRRESEIKSWNRAKKLSFLKGDK